MGNHYTVNLQEIPEKVFRMMLVAFRSLAKIVCVKYELGLGLKQALFNVF